MTTPARTLLDVATILGAATVARFAETWLSTSVMTVAELELIVVSHRRHRGAGTLKGVLGSRSVIGEPDSPAESWLGRLVVRHGLPPPVLHHLVTLASGIVYELDWSYPEHRLALELDRYGVHLRSRDAFEADRHRRNELEIAGWRVLNFTERMVRGRPVLVVGQVTRALAATGYMRR